MHKKTAEAVFPESKALEVAAKREHNSTDCKKNESKDFVHKEKDDSENNQSAADIERNVLGCIELHLHSPFFRVGIARPFANRKTSSVFSYIIPQTPGNGTCFSQKIVMFSRKILDNGGGYLYYMIEFMGSGALHNLVPEYLKKGGVIPALGVRHCGDMPLMVSG